MNQDLILFDPPVWSSSYVADTEKYCSFHPEQDELALMAPFTAVFKALLQLRVQQERHVPRARDIILCILWGPKQLLVWVKEDQMTPSSLTPLHHRSPPPPGSLGSRGRGWRLPQHFSPLSSPRLPHWLCFSDL